MKGKLYLIPVPLGDDALHSIPSYVIDVINQTDVFVVEALRTARRFIKAVNRERVIDSLTFFEYNEHSKRGTWEYCLAATLEGRNVGLMSEAGCPAVADPGADVVSLAYKMGIEVVPLVGPNSILLALMASGFRNQGFHFHHYLPHNVPELMRVLKQLEKQLLQTKHTQIFIETPYRNMQLLKVLCDTLAPETRLCIASDLTLETQMVCTKNIKDWKKDKAPDLHKHPAVFLIGI